MASLQDRLQAVFGSLGPASDTSAAWKPAQQQVFRSGAIDDAGNSSDEEYEERQRRETVPGELSLVKLPAAAAHTYTGDVGCSDEFGAATSCCLPLSPPTALATAAPPSPPRQTSVLQAWRRRWWTRTSPMRRVLGVLGAHAQCQLYRAVLPLQQCSANRRPASHGTSLADHPLQAQHRLLPGAGCGGGVQRD